MSMNCMEAAEAQFQTALKVQTVVTLYNVCANVINVHVIDMSHNQQ